MESHDLNSDEGLDALLSAAKPADLADQGFTERVVAGIPPRPRFDWSPVLLAIAFGIGCLAVARDPVLYAQLQHLLSTLSTSGKLGLGLVILTCLVAVYGNPLGEESRD